MPAKITVLGWFEHSNTGDESYKLSFPATFKDYEFRFIDRLTPEVISTSDAFILGGGDIMADSFLDQMSRIKKPKHIISVSANVNVDPSKLSGFNNIFVREKKSIDILYRKGVTASYYPDISFALSGDKSRGRRIIKRYFESQKRELYDKVVVVVMNGFLADAEANSYDVRKFINFHKLAYDLGHVFDYTNASFFFVPFGQDMPWDDRTTNMWVAQKCKFWRKNAVLWSEPNVQNILDIFASADATISTRLHSTIFSIATGTPFIDIVHNHKNQWMLETINKSEHSLQYDCMDVERLKLMLKSILFSDKNTFIKDVQSLKDRQKTLLRGLSNVILTS